MNACNWTDYVDDNFHFTEEDERYLFGIFTDLGEAVAACRVVVDRFLLNASATTADELFDLYSSFGDDPWMLPAAGTQPFSVMDYARKRCNELRP